MALNDDPWIVQNSQIAPEKLHALGVVNYRWQNAEIGLRTLLVLTAGIPWGTAWAIIHDMGDVALSESIKQLLQGNRVTDEFKEAVLYALKVYDANRINRNQLTHYLPGALKDSDLTRMKGPEFDPQPIADSLDDIRRVAAEINALVRYLQGLLNILAWWSVRRGALALTAPEGTEPPLPEKPPLPGKLWTPAPQAPTTPPRPPRPSRT